MIYYPAVPAVATTGPAPTPDITGQSAPLPALVIAVGGTAPDYLGMLLAVHGPDGNTYLRTAVLNIATWTTNGSNPRQARWDYQDALA
jgi:hypothetical protein